MYLRIIPHLLNYKHRNGEPSASVPELHSIICHTKMRLSIVTDFAQVLDDECADAAAGATLFPQNI